MPATAAQVATHAQLLVVAYHALSRILSCSCTDAGTYRMLFAHSLLLLLLLLLQAT
jgi:hypothetical protein